MQSCKRLVSLRWLSGVSASLVVGMLAGCGVHNAAPPTNFDNPNTLQGQVFAGRNYMAGATVNIYQTQSTGVAQADGTYVGKAKLLTTVTANTTGGWSLQNLNCTAGDQVYVTAVGGTPYPSGQNSTTLTANPNSVMLTAIGDCALLGQAGASNNVTSIVTNEASTVAAVWALRNFISLDGTTVNITSSSTNYTGKNGTGVPGNYAGLAHAFLNANNLSPFKVGNFPQYTNGSADGTGGGLVPVQELNSLAYVQYLCTIGSDGTSPGSFNYCSQLYQLTTPPGGTAPTNSLAAMLNIAKYPSNNATAILNFSLTPIPLSGQAGPGQTINAGVYVPALSAFGTLTNDWSVAIYYLPGYGATASSQGSTYPYDVTIDANDSAYFANPTGSTSTAGNVVALASNGMSLWNSATDTSKLIQPAGIASDASGHLWVVNGSSAAGTGFVQQIDAASGRTLAQYPSTSTSLYGVAVDTLGNVWYTSNSTTGQNLHELQIQYNTFAEANFPVPPAFVSAGLTQVRPDSNNNIWVAALNTSLAQSVVFPNTGTAAAPTYNAGLLASSLGGANTYGITVDASGNAWYAPTGTGGGLFKSTLTGASTLQSVNVATNTAATSRYMDTDGAGNIWYPDSSTGTSLYQYRPSSNVTAAYYPCYNAATTGSSQTCTTGISMRQSLAIDSTGSIWVASYANSGGGRIVQIIGLAAPAVPLRAMGQAGVMP